MMSKTNAAFEILQEYGKPLSVGEIISIALYREMITVKGLTPKATLNADLLNENKRRLKQGRKTRFKKVGNATWGLTEWYE